MKKIKKKIFKIVLYLLGIAIIIGIFMLGIFALWISNMQIPNLDAFEERRVDQSSKIFDRTGEILLFDVFENTKRTVVPFEEISENIKNATIAIEDSNFYNHRGIDFRGIVRAVGVNISEQDLKQGGSTITQQVVKNSVLTSDKKISRKVKEWIFSIRLERVLEKDDILNIYLNESPYGGSIYGVEQASISFFGKTASDVSIAEAAYLAALPKAPTTLSPYGQNKEMLDSRKNLVLREMLRHNFVSENEYQEALQERVKFLPRDEGGIKAPHFVMYVKEYLEEEFGRDVLEQQGLKIITTLDYPLQIEAEEVALKYALSNKDRFDSENVAISVIDPKTGEILVMVGSRDYFDSEIDGNYNVTTAKRQPGSAFKPFAYAEAFNKGYTPNTVLFDLRTQFSARCSPLNLSSLDGCYSPQNYDMNFRGPMTMRDALAQSVNVPAVKTLYLAGIRDTARLAERMGVSGLSNDLERFGLTLVLGGGEVSLLEITAGYGVFANEGIKVEISPILEVIDKNGNILIKKEKNEEKVLSKDVALMVSDILSDNVARTPLFGSNSLLHFPNRDVAVKTGTTNDYRDAWIIGYTPSIVVGAWAGNNDNRSMNQEIAGMVVAPLWNEYMKTVLSETQNTFFPAPPQENSFNLKPVLRGVWLGGESYLIDTISGKLATRYTPEETIKEIVTGGVHSILHWVDRKDPRGPVPTNPHKDDQYELWESPVRLWVERQGITPITNVDIPDEEDDVHLPVFFPEVLITKPSNNETVSYPINIEIDYAGHNPLSRIDVLVNETVIRTFENSSMRNIAIPLDNYIGEEITLTVVVYDTVLNKNKDSITVFVE